MPLDVVSDTLGHASIRVTMDVYGHLLAPAKMHAADAMRQALWLDGLPDFDPLATSLAAGDGTETANSAVTSDSVGRPGLDPGTLGLTGGTRSSRAFGCFHRPHGVGNRVHRARSSAPGSRQSSGKSVAKGGRRSSRRRARSGRHNACAPEDPWRIGLDATMPRAHCEARMAATSATGSCTTGPVTLTSARTMVPTKGNGAS